MAVTASLLVVQGDVLAVGQWLQVFRAVVVLHFVAVMHHHIAT